MCSSKSKSLFHSRYLILAVIFLTIWLTTQARKPNILKTIMPVVQSSTYEGGNAKLAIDRNTNSTSCTHTKSQYYPWWQVDMQESYTVLGVNITIDCCVDRLRFLTITLTDRKNSVRKQHCHITEKLFVDVVALTGDSHYFPCYGKKPRGRFLKIASVNPNKTYLTMCEVEVEGVATKPVLPTVNVKKRVIKNVNETASLSCKVKFPKTIQNTLTVTWTRRSNDNGETLTLSKNKKIDIGINPMVAGKPKYSINVGKSSVGSTGWSTYKLRINRLITNDGKYKYICKLVWPRRPKGISKTVTLKVRGARQCKLPPAASRNYSVEIFTDGAYHKASNSLAIPVGTKFRLTCFNMTAWTVVWKKTYESSCKKNGDLGLGIRYCFNAFCRVRPPPDARYTFKVKHKGTIPIADTDWVSMHAEVYYKCLPGYSWDHLMVYKNVTCSPKGSGMPDMKEQMPLPPCKPAKYCFLHQKKFSHYYIKKRDVTKAKEQSFLDNVVAYGTTLTYACEKGYTWPHSMATRSMTCGPDSKLPPPPCKPKVVLIQ